MREPNRPWIEPAPGGDPVGPSAPDARGEDGAAPGRRDFLKLLGVGAAASLAACKRLPVEHAIPVLVAPEEVTPGVPARYASTCTACPAACGLLVSVLDGRPVKLEGNPAHPVSRGGLCAVGQADLRGLYDPTRQKGPRLDGRPATWAALDARVLERLAPLRGGAPGRVAVLSTTIVSPTAREAVLSFLAPFGGRLVEHDAEARPASAVLDAYEALTGSPRFPYLDLGAADLLVTLGADLLGTGPDPVGHARARAERRRDATRGEARHVHAEGSLSLTGAAADERLVLDAAGRRRFAFALLARVAAATPGPLAAAVAAAVAGVAVDPVAFRLAADLVRNPGRALVASGSTDLGEQLAVALLNRLLDVEGKTLDLSRPSLVRRGRDRELASLLADLEAGKVAALFVLGADPVDQLPGGPAIAAALAKLPLAVALTDRPTATAAACAAVASTHHGLESWGDAEPRAGFVSLAQPALRPLFDTRSPFESFLVWSGAPATEWRAHLRETWRRRAGEPADFARRWTEAVATAVAPAPSGATVPPPLDREAEALTLLAAAANGAPAEPELEVELVAEVGLRDGSRAHVPWLRELPDPLTRVSWTPCIRVAPARAAVLGVSDGDVLAIRGGDGAVVELPARITPGQHPRVLGVPVGYGRLDGDGGVSTRNGYRLARLSAGRLATEGLAVTATRTSAAVRLPLMQPNGEAHERPVVHQVGSRDGAVPHGEHGAHGAAGTSLWPERHPTSPKWEMVVDLDACTGCSACVVACQAENNLPVVGADEILRSRDMYWLRIDRYFLGDPASPDVLFEPMLCAQCDNAPCETVCPVAATVHSEDGLNQQVYNRCVGTRYCANNCPYKVRRFNWFDHPVKEPLERLVLNPNVVVRSRGVMEKCTFCVQRIQAERIESRVAGREDWRGRGVETACQQTCPARAISFGDATDPDGEVLKRKKGPRAFQVLADLGVGPAVTYLAKVRSRPGVGEKGEGA